MIPQRRRTGWQLPTAWLFGVTLYAWAPGIALAGYAVSFDGFDDYIQLPASTALNDATDRSFSLSAWVKPQDSPPVSCSTNTNTCIYSAITRPGYHTHIGYEYGQRYRAGIWNSSNVGFTLSSGSIAPGVWHHLCLTVDTATLRMAFYVDGAQVPGSPLTFTGTLKDYGTLPYYIGAGNPGASAWTWHFKGAIDEPRIYTRALTAAEVTAQYNAGQGQYGSPEPALIAGWHLDEGTALTASDYSGRGHTGTLKNGASWMPGLVREPVAMPITLEAEAMPTKPSGSGSVTDGWALYSSGALESPVQLPVTGTYELRVVARGDYAGAQWPQLELRINGSAIATTTVDSASWKTFTVTRSLASGTYQLGIVFTNDYYSPPQDRNLYVDKLVIVPPGGTPADTTAPTISGLAASGVTTTGATITWTTDEAATSQVEYGLTTSYGQTTALDNALVTSHSTTLTSLTAGMLYHYRVRSKDAAGNERVSADATFTTGAADTTPPIISFTSPKDGDILIAPSP